MSFTEKVAPGAFIPPTTYSPIEISYSIQPQLVAADFDTAGTSVVSVESISNTGEPGPTIIYTPFAISNFQRYSPIFSTFFTDITAANYNCIAFNHRFHVRNLTTIFDTAANQILERPVFVKFSPMLNPIRFVVDELGPAESVFPLPLPECAPGAKPTRPEYGADVNAAYTDAFFCFLSSCMMRDYNMVHGIDYYGSFIGVQEWFKQDVTDDLEHLAESAEFCANLGKRVFLEHQLDDDYFGTQSRGKRTKLCISGDTECKADIDITMDINPIIPDKIDLPIESLTEEDMNCIGDPIQLHRQTHPNSTDGNTHKPPHNKKGDEDEGDEGDDEDDDEDDEDDDEDDEDEEEEGDEGDEEDDLQTDSECGDTHIYIRDFPVHLICLEKCEGTMDELFAEHGKMTEDESIAAIFQVIITLAAYQKTLHFTHNDLHTNNVMFVPTKLTHLYYTFGATHYRVPTFGRIFKIIDFGRSIYKFGGKVFCNDSYSKNGDARGQYNCPPFFDKSRARIDPNYSFDLCRLGCSLFDLVLEPDEQKGPLAALSGFKRMIREWCVDDQGKNLVYTAKGDRERYPGFLLYKMISRKKHNCIPKKEINRPIFRAFVCTPANILAQKRTAPHSIINIDRMPPCVSVSRK